jgi:hypothetical protein
MKSTELMIGNLVNRTNKLTREKLTIELTASCILDIHANGEMSSFIYEPIPLTEELLLRFGLARIGYQYYELGDIKLYSSEFGWILTFKGEEVREIRFIHTLQNISHAITGTELILK